MSPRAIADRQAALSANAQERALAAVPKRRRGWLRTIIASARKHVAARETTKDLGLRFFELTRRVVTEAQNRLSATLASRDDIHFLVNTEVAAALRGELGTAEAAAIVAQRRRDFDWSERVDVPKVQDGVATFERRRQAPLASDAELVGVAVSPGVVDGVARVVLSPDEASLNPGDILVAPVTDVAWTPLFLRASALVVEVGGPLSHGSIVAREFGIPAVTAVKGATQQILTGDRLRVDGHRGIVSITRSK
jgi:pyruvate,water dikinase